PNAERPRVIKNGYKEKRPRPGGPRPGSTIRAASFFFTRVCARTVEGAFVAHADRVEGKPEAHHPQRPHRLLHRAPESGRRRVVGRGRRTLAHASPSTRSSIRARCSCSGPTSASCNARRKLSAAPR